MRSHQQFAIPFALLLGASAALAQQDCVGRGDINADGFVSASDLDVFTACLAGPDLPPDPGGNPAACDRADLQDDNDVDLADFLALMPLVGNAYFDYGPHRENTEAEMLTMALKNTLRAADAEYERILRDLTLIRAAYPDLETVIDDPDYVPNQLIVGTDDPPSDDYYALNDYYLVVDEEVHSWGRVLTFCDNLNAPLLAQQYMSLPGVNWADPNWLIGIDDYITVQALGTTYQYHIDDGFWDCFDGCDCHNDWVIDVAQDGTVTLVSFTQWGQPWCEWNR